MINGRRSVNGVGRHARGRRGQVPRIHGDLGAGMDPPDARRAAGWRTHARCLHHPGPHLARLTADRTGRERKKKEKKKKNRPRAHHPHHTQLAYRSIPLFIPLEREKLRLPALGDEPCQPPPRAWTTSSASRPAPAGPSWCRHPTGVPSRAALATFFASERPRMTTKRPCVCVCVCVSFSRTPGLTRRRIDATTASATAAMTKSYARREVGRRERDRSDASRWSSTRDDEPFSRRESDREKRVRERDG